MTRRFLLQTILLATVYVVLALLGLKLDAVAGFATLVWPPSGLSLAALLLFGQRLWPGVALGAFLANLFVGAPLPVAAGIALGNTLEAVFGAGALRRIPGFHISLTRLADVLGLIVLAAVLSTLVSSVIGVSSLLLGKIITLSNLIQTWRAWWLGDLVGDLLIAPLLLTWFAPGGNDSTWPLGVRSRVPAMGLRQWGEAAALGVALGAVSIPIFSSGTGITIPMSYLVFPPLIWAVLRFGQRGGTMASLAISAVAIWGTARHFGPFAAGAHRLSEVLDHLQIFVAVVAATIMILGSVMEERSRAVRSRDEVLGIVSHDLRNMLNSISLSAQSLAKKMPEDGQNSLGLIVRSVKRMNGLIGDLRDVAAIEVGRLSLRLEVCSTAALIREAAEAAQPLSADRAQTLIVEAPSPDIQIMGDRERLLQVLANLVGNAIKFTPEGDTVTLKGERIGDSARFAVTDSGPGISRDQMVHVFERYWQANATAYPGSGLGLSIAKGIVEAHGGRIWAESEEGKGSRFFFTLNERPTLVMPEAAD